MVCNACSSLRILDTWLRTVFSDSPSLCIVRRSRNLAEFGGIDDGGEVSVLERRRPNHHCAVARRFVKRIFLAVKSPKNIPVPQESDASAPSTQIHSCFFFHPPYPQRCSPFFQHQKINESHATALHYRIGSKACEKWMRYFIRWILCLRSRMQQRFAASATNYEMDIDASRGGSLYWDSNSGTESSGGGEA